MNNFYTVLGVDNTATKSEIKKAYHKLVIEYHPDKSIHKNSKEKFQEIQAAYEILSDDQKRKEYDGLSKEDRMQLFDIIKMYFTEINPARSNIFNTILDSAYGKSEDEFRNDVNSFNIKNIFTKIMKDFMNTATLVESDPTLNYYTVRITLKEKYENKMKRIIINGNEYLISLLDDTFVIMDNDKPITVSIIVSEDSYFQPINKYDLLCILNVSLSQYLYGGKIKIHHVNNEIILFNFDCCLEKKPIFIIESKGLIKDIAKNRGDLYIYLTIDGVNSLPEGKSNEYEKTVKETLTLMFPPISHIN